ncbi:MAG: DUF1573 domain-containing protein [Bacteroidales bacterium]|nr:DUF1573 domain-containing protein [Bacteroidales bacterium]
MKTRIFLTAALFASLSAMGQTIDFKNTKHDYGKINEDDGVAYHQFEFKNNGDAPLIIKKVESSCGCTTPEWPKNPVAPGQTGTIKVGFNPTGRPNKFSKSITVHSNAKTPTVVLQIAGFVNPHVKTVDEIYRQQIGDLRFKQTHLSLGKATLGTLRTDTLKFLNKGMMEARVEVNFAKNQQFINFKVQPEAVKPNEFGLIIVEYDPDKRNDWGFVHDRFWLTINGTRAQNQISISANIEEDFSKLTPAQQSNAPVAEFKSTTYDFGNEHAEGKLVEHEFQLTNKGKSDLIIRKLKPSCGCTTVNPDKMVLKPGERTQIKAQLRTNGYSGRQSKSITVITNDPKQPSITLRITGSVVKNNEKK